MPPAVPDGPGGESLTDAAAAWFARMRGPDAERHRPAFEQWLAADPAHRQAYDRIALRWDQAGLVGHTPSGQAREGLSQAPRRAAFPAHYYALAASVVVVIAIGALLLLSPGRDAGSRAPLIAATGLTSPVGTIRRVTLADGSVVTLDTGTRLEVAFTSAERRLRLVTGRARFEVAHDAARRFVVAAGEGEVVATGTIFDVSLVGAHPRVQLIEGSVEVRGRPATPGAAGPPVARLSPGQALALGKPETAPSTAPAAEAQWVSGMLSFDETPLDDAIAEANRYSNRQIRLGDDALARLKVTGAFRAGDQESIARAIAAGFGLRVERMRDGNLELRER